MTSGPGARTLAKHASTRTFMLLRFQGHLKCIFIYPHTVGVNAFDRKRHTAE